VPGLPADPIVVGLPASAGPARQTFGGPARLGGPARQLFGGLPGEAYKTWSPR